MIPVPNLHQCLFDRLQGVPWPTSTIKIADEFALFIVQTQGIGSDRKGWIGNSIPEVENALKWLKKRKILDAKGKLIK